jgi:hypothetical protein
VIRPAFVCCLTRSMNGPLDCTRMSAACRGKADPPRGCLDGIHDEVHVSNHSEDESRLAQLRKVRQNGPCASRMGVTARCKSLALEDGGHR